jgi:hypothetical protein
VCNRGVSSIRPVIHNGWIGGMEPSAMLFSFCSYHKARSERKRRMVFHRRPQAREPVRQPVPPQRIPLAVLKISGAPKWRLT